MYILDTNVVSELRKSKSANKNVVSWASSVPRTNLFISAITVLELEIGILGKERKDTAQGAILKTWLHNIVLPTFKGRVLALDTKTALLCAKLHVPDPAPERDAIIAATAQAYNMTLVTRNTRDYKRATVELINPWKYYNDG